jgi:GTP-binding protein YchF
VVHVAGRLDPLADIEVINTELSLADLEAVERAIERTGKRLKAGKDRDATRKMGVLERLRDCLDEGHRARNVALDADERALVRDVHLITTKPVMYIANVSEDGFENNAYLDIVREKAVSENARVVPVCAAIEAEIAQLDEADRKEFLADLGYAESGLDQVVRAGYELLELLTFFTAGPREVRAWTVRRGSTAPQAAGRIHTDFERGFIRAEVTAYEEYVALGGEQGAKEAGKLRLEGKQYIVAEGDVMHFRFNV